VREKDLPKCQDNEDVYHRLDKRNKLPSNFKFNASGRDSFLLLFIL